MSTPRCAPICSSTKRQDIGGDFVPGRKPILGRYYRLAIGLASDSTIDNELFGVQLRCGNTHCGWIRVYDSAAITTHLNNGYKVVAQVVALSEFQWMGERCYWGRVQWEAVEATCSVQDGV